MKNNKIILGTTQFGIHYGVSNRIGATSSENINKILKLSRLKKIQCIYTSNYYGKANKVLGKKNIKKFNIIIKFKEDDFINKDILIEIKKSEKLLKANIRTIIVDKFESIQIKKAKKIYTSLKNLKKNKIIQHFGYAIYSFKNLKKICKNFKPDIIQSPYNIIDRRIEKKKYLNFLQKKNIEIHVRSIFLQGLLLMDFKKIPKKFNKWSSLFKNWDYWLKKENQKALDVCYSFVLKNKFINKILIGVNDFSQFKEIVKIKVRKNLNYPNISSTSQKLINPINW